MPINVSIEGGDLRPDQVEAAGQGGFDGDHVWVQYLTQHDGRVRPSHAALHGTFWRADDMEAPAPPLDYGCRCYLRYAAAPGTVAARVLPEAEAPKPAGSDTFTPGVLATRSNAYATYLDSHLPEWRAVAEIAAKAVPAKRIEVTVAAIQAADPKSTDVRELAMMIVEAMAARDKKGQ